MGGHLTLAPRRIDVGDVTEAVAIGEKTSHLTFDTVIFSPHCSFLGSGAGKAMERGDLLSPAGIVIPLWACLLQDDVSTLLFLSCEEHAGIRHHQPRGTFLKLGLCSGGYGSMGGILQEYI